MRYDASVLSSLCTELENFVALFFPAPRVSSEVLPVEATFFSPDLLQRLSKNVDGEMQKQG